MTTCYFETLAAFAVSCLLSAMIIPNNHKDIYKMKTSSK